MGRVRLAGPLSGLFARSGLALVMIITAALALAVGLMLAMIAAAVLGSHIGEGAFVVMPHTVMAGIPMAITAFTIVAFVVGWRRCCADGALGRWPAFSDAMSSTATMRNLGGDNSDGDRCPGRTPQQPGGQRYHRHLLRLHAVLCLDQHRHHLLSSRPRGAYGYLELPVVLGTVGGVMLCIGTAGQRRKKRRIDPTVRPLSGSAWITPSSGSCSG